MPKIRPRGRWFVVLQAAVVAAIAFFLVRFLLNLDWKEFFRNLSGAAPDALLLSLLMTVLGGLLVAFGWSLILRALGRPVPALAAVRVYYLSEMAKYVPGKIWTALGRAVLLEKWGVPKVVTVSTVGIMLIILAASGVLVTGVSLPFWPVLKPEGVSGWFYPLVLGLPLLGLLALHPRIFDPVLNWFLRKVEKVPVPVHLPYRATAGLVLYWSGLWLIKGTATWILLRAVFPDSTPPPLPWLVMTGVMALSWIIGVLSPFTPAGLGIAELTIAVLLPLLFGLPASSSAVFAFICRIWAVLADLVCLALVLPFGRTRLSPGPGAEVHM